ncbi:hypothetical protein ABZ338_05970 [Streptomyces albidoflavus]|uniref:hypothetical protein n=1 Tax=Streptomyces albidoflavus TaxID=1886 RepID=UPI0033DB8DFA
MLDLEEILGRVWNPDVRPLAAEAYRSYTTGSARACIILTWGAVAADLIDKLQRLGEDGEGTAKTIAQKIDAARAKSDVKAMQDVEAALLENAQMLELLDFVEARDLQRLREDRHLCAHPSLRPLGDFYAPSLELARAHLVGALQAVLIHPPSQGRNVVDRFTGHVADAAFTGNEEYLTHTFFDQVKPTVRRRIVDVAAKVACLEPDGLPDPPGASKVADRMADCLRLFAARDRTLVATHLKKAVSRLGDKPRAVQIRSVGRLGDLDVFWSAVTPPLRGQLGGLVASIQSRPDMGLSDIQSRLLSLVGLDQPRKLLPELETKFAELDLFDRALVINKRPGKYFTQRLPPLLEKEAAHNFRMAELLTRLAVLPCAPHLDEHTLATLLETWTANDQCLYASEMPQNALTLYRTTQHLRLVDESIWKDFITRARSLVPGHEGSSAYHYNEVAEAIGM